MKNKNINEEIRKFCDEITKTENKVAILSTNHEIMMAGNTVHLLGTLAMILNKIRATGIPEKLLEDTFELSKKSNNEIKEQAKAVDEKKFDNEIEKIEKLLNLLKEINNE